MIILDISHYQTKIDWDKIKDPVILKCSESLTYLDPTFKERREILRKKGLYLGCYHFFRDVDPIKQADWFLSHEHKEGELLILDFEINCENPVEKCKQFLDRVGSKWLYTNDARALKYSWSSDWNFWIARYADYTGKFYPDFKPKFCGWKIHQYTSRGKVNGIVGNVDMNYTPLSLLELTQITQPGAISEPTIDYTVFSQKDPRWEDIKLGFGNYTIGSDGCFLTCLAMMTGITPDKVNEILKNDGGFSGSLIVSDKAAKVLGLQLLKGNSNIPGKMTNINYMPDWSPSIKEVDYNSKTARNEQHFVLRVIEDGKRYIIDPLGGKKREINYYMFKSYRLFKK
jgi:lysozyme